MDYRFSFNGQEKTPEIADGHTTAKYWEYDSRIARRWNVDPRPHVSISPYSIMQGNPILYKDILGDTIKLIDKDEKFTYYYGVQYNGNSSFIKNTIMQLDYLMDNPQINPTLAQETAQLNTIAYGFTNQTNIIKSLAEDKEFNWFINSQSYENLTKKENRTVYDGIVTLGPDGQGYALTNYYDLVGYKTNTGGLQSPLPTLYHEGGHAYIKKLYYELAKENPASDLIFVLSNDVFGGSYSLDKGKYLNFEERFMNEVFEIPMAEYLKEGIRTSDYGSSIYETATPLNKYPKNFIGPIELPPNYYEEE